MKVDPYLFLRGMHSQILDWQRRVLLIVRSSCLCRVSSHEERTRRWGPLPCFSRLSRNLTMPARPQTHSWEEGRREKEGGGKRDALISSQV